MARVLVVEDYPDIAAPLVRTLEREGYDVTWVDHGQAALDELAGTPVDAMILDLGLPDMDGLEVCAQARASGFAGGIIICTARGDELDRVVGLDNGADDYLAKPFSLAELQARVRALLRRAAPIAAEAPAPADGLHIDRPGRRVTFAGTSVNLTTKEYDVLALLAERSGAVVERDRLMTEVWDENWYGSTKTLDVTVGRLRQKLEDLGVPERVVTVRGVGFRLERGGADA
ncbi:MAG: response regulator transcription factor [Nocardioides sp.]